MTGEFKERRRFPRVEIARVSEMRLGQRLRVRVIDISASGVLLASDQPLPVGGRGRLQILLGGLPFEGNAEIRREQLALEGRGHLLGASVTPAQPKHQAALDQFLSRAGT